MTSRGRGAIDRSPGVGDFDGGAEWDVRVQLADAHDLVAASVLASVARMRTSEQPDHQH